MQKKWITSWFLVNRLYRAPTSFIKGQQFRHLTTSKTGNNQHHHHHQQQQQQHQQQQQQQQQQQHQDQQQKKGKLLIRYINIRNLWNWKTGAGWTILSFLDWWLLVAGGWLSWHGVFMKWTPIGICLLAAVQWQYIIRDSSEKNKELRERVLKIQTNIYCSLPLRLMSRSWGWIADRRIPIPLRPIVYGSYSAAFGVNINEASSSDFKDYKSLADFFTRSLKENARLIDDTSDLVSPADGRVLYLGPVVAERTEQVKGVTYSLKTFFGPANWSNHDSSKYIDNCRLEKDTMLFQCIIYLAPGDYHRFHSPTTWTPQIRRYFAGELLSVNPKIAKFVPGLFGLNERALYLGNWEHGFFSFTAVGATNVGSIKIYMDEQLKTNRWTGIQVGYQNPLDNYEELILPTDTNLYKGEMLGQFNMGSTVVLIFEAPTNFKFLVKPGETLRMGEALGTYDKSMYKTT